MWYAINEYFDIYHWKALLGTQVNQQMKNLWALLFYLAPLVLFCISGSLVAATRT